MANIYVSEGKPSGTGPDIGSVVRIAAMADDVDRGAAKDALTRRLGAVLREKRSKKKLSQQDFATKAGLSRTSVFYIEKGEQECTLDTFVRLSSALNIPASALLEEVVKPRPRGRDSWEKSVLSALKD